jgi:hypothetical protein
MSEENNKMNIQDVPLILPDESRTKIKPIEPGGLEFPNMDKSVYEYISPSRKTMRSEQVMPEPEQPVLSIRKTEEESVFDISSTKQNDQDKESIFSEPLENTIIDDSKSEINIITVDQTDNRLLNDNKPFVNKGQKYKLQISASKTESHATKEWNKALKNNKDLIGKYTYKINKVDLGEKGVIYKLYIGSFSSYNEANSLCKRLLKRKQSCIVVND